MSETALVRVERSGAVAVLTVDRPERRNALDLATLHALRAAQARCRAEAGEDDPLRVLVVTGAPPAFCAGADLGGVDGETFAAALGAVLRGFVELPFPVIAAIDGPALGAGVQLAVACDLRVATPTSRFAVPAARLGLVVDPWTVRRLHEQFTPSVARAMLLAAEAYDGERLHGTGAVHRLGDLTAALAWADELALLAPLTIAGHKLAAERVGTWQPSGASAAGLDDPDVEAARRAAWASTDAVEGRAAFAAKRPPRFTGR